MKPLFEDEINRLYTLITLAADGSFVLAVYNTPEIPRYITNKLKERLSVPVREFSITGINRSPLAILRREGIKHQLHQAIVFYDIERGFPEAIGHINLGRDELAKYDSHLIFWVSRENFVRIAQEAPDFFSRITGAKFDFTLNTRQEFGILGLIDVVNFTPQSNDLGPKYTQQFLDYYYQESKQIVEAQRGFSWIKSIGDAVIFFGDVNNTAGFINIILDLFHARKIGDRSGFKVDLRLAAHCGFFRFWLDNDGHKVDFTGAEAIKLFRMEKTPEASETSAGYRTSPVEILVTETLFEGLSSSLQEHHIDSFKESLPRKLKGFTDTPTQVYHLYPPRKREEKVIGNLLTRCLEELRDRSQRITVLGKLYPPVDMEENFINLTVEQEGRLEGRGVWRRLPGHHDGWGTRVHGSEEKDAKQWDDIDEELAGMGMTKPTLAASDIFAMFNKGIVYGLPGAGKTTVLHYFVHCAFKIEGVVPVYTRCIHLPDYETWCRQKGYSPETARYEVKSCLEYLLYGFLFPSKEKSPNALSPDERASLMDAEREMLSAWNKSRLALYVDGLDEASIERRQIIFDAVKTVAQASSLRSEGKETNTIGRENPAPTASSLRAEGKETNRIFLASRPIEREKYDEADEPVFRIANLDMEQVRKLARSFYGQDSECYRRFDTMVWQQEAVKKIAGTPLTALLLMVYYEVFGRIERRYVMFDLLLKFFLLRVWEEIRDAVVPHRGIEWFFREAKGDSLLDKYPELSVQYDCLSLLSYECLYQSIGGEPLRSIPLATIRQYIEKGAGQKADEWLEKFRQEQLLSASGYEEYIIVHSTVMEFLAARMIAGSLDSDGSVGLYARNCDKNAAQNVFNPGNGSSAGLYARKYPPNAHNYAHKGLHYAGRPLLTVKEIADRDVKYDLETLPVAAGRDMDTGCTIISRIGQGFADRQLTDEMVSLAYRCLVEVEGIEKAELQGLRTIPLQDETKQEIRRNRPMVEWLYQQLASIILSEDSRRLEEVVTQYEKGLSGLPGTTLFKEYLQLETFFSQMEDLRLRLLKSVMSRDVEMVDAINEWAGPWYLQRYGVPAGSLLNLDTAEYHPDDKNFGYYQARVGRELMGFLGSPNLRHEGAIRACAFSPDGKTVLSGSGDNTLRMWDASSGREIRSFFGHDGRVYTCAFSPDGRAVLSGSEDGTLRLWDASSGREIRSFSGHADSVRACAFSPDGRAVLSGSEDKTLRLWDASSGREIRSFSGHTSSVSACAFSPDGRAVLSGSWDNTLRLWDASSGREIRLFSGHTSSVLACAFSPDDRMLLSGSDDNTLRLWDASSGREIRSFSGHTSSVLACAFSPDGQTVLSGSWDNTLRLWDASIGREIRSFSGHTSRVWSCAFSPDGRAVLSGSEDKTLRFWDASSGREICLFSGHSGCVWSCAFSPDGRAVLSGSWDNTLRLWDASTGREIRSFSGHTGYVWSCAFSPDGRAVLSGSLDNTMRLWDASSGREIRSFSGHESSVLACAFSPDGRAVLSGSRDNTLWLWNASNGRKIRLFSGHTSDVTSCAFSPDGQKALSGSEDNTLRLWDASTGREIRSFSGHTGGVWSCAFSPDGRAVLSGSRDNTLWLWDTSSGQAIRSFSGHTGSVLACAFSPDGRAVISCSEDKTLRLWETETGRELHCLNLPWTPRALSLNPQQPGIIVTANSNCTLTLFDLSSLLSEEASCRSDVLVA